MNPPIPEEWLADIEPAGWRPRATHFAFGGVLGQIVLVMNFVLLTPPVRDPGTPYFDRDRLRRVATRIVRGEPQEPIHVELPDDAERFIVRDGMHRFYLSRKLGFTAIPALLVSYGF
jgi:hypothetical protein